MNYFNTPVGRDTTLNHSYRPYDGALKIDHLYNEICNLTQCHKDMVEVSTLGVLSLAIQDFITVERPGIGVGPVSLFVINVADSGERKSTLLRTLLTPFRIAEAHCEDEYEKKEAFEYEVKKKVWLKRSKETEKRLSIAINNHQDTKALEAELLRSESNKPVPPVKKRWIYSKTTPLAIFESLKAGNKSIGIIDSDASGILLGKTFSDPSLFNVLWDGDSVELDRPGKESIALKDSRLSICLGVQKQFFQEFCEKFNSKARNVGFLARTLIAAPPSIKGQEFEFEGGVLNHSHYDEYEQLIKEILLRGKYTEDINTGVMRFDEMGKAVLKNFQNEMNQRSVDSKETKFTNEFISRAVDVVSRIAAVRSFFHTKFHQIHINDLHYAIDLFRRQIDVHSQWVDQYLNERNEAMFSGEVDRFFFDKCMSGKLPVPVDARWLYANYTEHSKRGKVFLEPQYHRLLSEKRITLLEGQKSQFVLNDNFFIKFASFMPWDYKNRMQALIDSRQLILPGSLI